MTPNEQLHAIALDLLQHYYAAEYNRLHYLPATEDDPLRQGRERDLIELKKEVADYRKLIDALLMPTGTGVPTKA